MLSSELGLGVVHLHYAPGERLVVGSLLLLRRVWGLKEILCRPRECKVVVF